jgi:hypothetical protein
MKSSSQGSVGSNASGSTTVAANDFDSQQINGFRYAKADEIQATLTRLQNQFTSPWPELLTRIADYLGDFARNIYRQNKTALNFTASQQRELPTKITTLLAHPFIGPHLGLDTPARRYQGERREDANKAKETVFALLLKHYPKELQVIMKLKYRPYPAKTLNAFLADATKAYCNKPSDALRSLAAQLIELGADGTAKPSAFEPTPFAYLTAKMQANDPLLAIFVAKYKPTVIASIEAAAPAPQAAPIPPAAAPSIAAAAGRPPLAMAPPPPAPQALADPLALLGFVTANAVTRTEPATPTPRLSLKLQRKHTDPTAAATSLAGAASKAEDPLTAASVAGQENKIPNAVEGKRKAEELDPPQKKLKEERDELMVRNASLEDALNTSIQREEVLCAENKRLRAALTASALELSAVTAQLYDQRTFYENALDTRSPLRTIASPVHTGSGCTTNFVANLGDRSPSRRGGGASSNMGTPLSKTL